MFFRMLNNQEFDLWADHYDDSVKQADENNQYPFAGYSALMNAVYTTVMSAAPANVLDVGFGTALLTAKLYEGGNTITGIDFSADMIEIAARKMPDATLLQWDFTRGVPPALHDRTFDFIVSTYALHHLTDDVKVGFLSSLMSLLEPGGVILIGDVCFPTRDELLACKADCGDEWDDEEFYFVFSELQKRLSPICRLDFRPFSFCSGVIEIRNKI
jgi:putative AdoMet-dependent methyltransferase